MKPVHRVSRVAAGQLSLPLAHGAGGLVPDGLPGQFPEDAYDNVAGIRWRLYRAKRPTGA